MAQRVEVQGEWSEGKDEEEEEPVEEEEDSLVGEVTVEAFPEEWKKEFEGLAHLGYLEEKVNDIPFHEFVVRTLYTAEKLEISQICAEHENTLGFNRAYKAAVVAAAMITVDGKPILVADKTQNAVRQKYFYVTNKWFDPVIDILYLKVDMLEKKQREIVAELLGA